MILQTEREEVVAFGQKLVPEGLSRGTSGNVSLYNAFERLAAVSPSGMPYDKIRPQDVVVMTPEGEIVDGGRKPTSEWMMHTIFYRKRDDIRAVIHTHPIYCSVLACLRENLPPVHYMIAVAGSDVRCADYATFGTPELARNGFDAMEGRKAAILANHGLLAGGETLDEALTVSIELEYVAELYLRSRAVGKPVILPPDEMELMAAKFEEYGRNAQK